MDDVIAKKVDPLFDASKLGLAPPIKRRNRANLRFPVSFDPDCPTLDRALTKLELACVYVYLDYFNLNGKLPPAERFRSALRAGFRKYGLDASVLSDQMIDSELFKDLFPLDPNKKLGDAVRRLAGFPNSESTAEECAYAIKYASDLLTLQKNSPVRILPTTGDIKRAIAAQLIVPELGSPMPSPETIVRQLGAATWKDAVKIALGISEQRAIDQLQTKVSLEDLMEDYKRAFEYFYGETFDEDDRYLTYDQLEQFREEKGGLGYRRYSNFIRKAVDAGIYININDLRRHAGLPVNKTSDNRKVRRTQEKWNPKQIVDGYMAAWKHIGLEQDPPTHAQLVEISLLQTSAINKSGMLDPVVAQARSIPEIRVPTQKAIEDHFYSLTRLLGHLEQEEYIPVRISSDSRIGKMAAVSLEKGRDPNLMPACIAERMHELASRTGKSSRTITR